VPGAHSVSISAVRPVSDGYYFIDVVSKIEDLVLQDDQMIRVAHNYISPGYFATLGIPLLAGRDFDLRDDSNSPKVVIISETMARRHFAKQNPIGLRITLHREDTREIVGVAKDARYANVKDAPRDVVYRPLFQEGIGFPASYEIRCAGPTAGVLRNVRDLIARMDPSLALFNVKTLEAQTEESLSRERLLALLASYFGAFALLLACIGLYGLVSYAVEQRTPELGLRMALGARPAAVRWMILRESTATVLVGVCAGLLGSLATVRLIQTLLFGLKPYDPWTLGGATLLLLVMSLAAGYLPADRASRIDPITALRHE
jgi:predicted permease